MPHVIEADEDGSLLVPPGAAGPVPPGARFAVEPRGNTACFPPAAGLTILAPTAIS